MTLHRKVRRLAPQNYLGRQTYFVTICCDQRASYLGEPPIAESVQRSLLECAAGCGFRLHAFCVMPDHVHFLAEGMNDRCDLREFVRLFKQRTSFAFRKLRRNPLWEMSYYDHILRSSDPIEDVACYIWSNPVRKNLCSHPGEFPHSGSQTIDWITRSAVGTSWSAPWKQPDKIS
jgi:REP element-mobilizing transposase RayT